MAEYIDRSVAIARLTRLEVTDSNATMADAKRVLADIPAADVAPVVRCKDCKWFIKNNNDEWWGCWLYHTIKVIPEDAPKPDDFCSYGERKDGDER
mgnify:CR=1 FL=1